MDTLNPTSIQSLEPSLSCASFKRLAGPFPPERDLEGIPAKNKQYWEFPKIMGTFLWVPIIGIIVYGSLYWGPIILGNYHIGFRKIRGTVLGVPIVGIIIFRGLCWGPIV